MNYSTDKALRLIVVAFGTSALCFHIANLSIMIWMEANNLSGAPSGSRGSVVGDLLTYIAWGVGFAVLALVIVLRVGHRNEAIFAALFLSLFSFWGVFIGGVPFDDEMWVPYALMIFDALVHPIGIRFTQLFPRALVRSDVTSLAVGRLTRWATVFPAVLLNPRIYWPVAIGFEVAIRLPLDSLGITREIDDPMHELHVVVWIALAITYMYASLRGGSPADRRRIFWIFEGVILLLVSQILGVAIWAIVRSELLFLDLVFWTDIIRGIASWLTLGCFAMAVFFAGAFDAGLILRRTTVATLSGMILLVVFVSMETAIAEVFGNLLGFESRIGGIVSGVIAALAFRPLSIWIDNRMQFRPKSTDEDSFDEDD